MFFDFLVRLVPNRRIRRILRARAAMPADIRPTFGEVIKAHTACYIPAYPELLGKNTKFAHYVGITIAKDAAFGHSCVIFQNTTIGAQPPGIASKNIGYPRLGDNVWVLAGAVVAGGISIGNDAVIGANSVVLSDIPAGAVAAGSPARVLRMRTPEEIEQSHAVGDYNRARTRRE